MKSPWMQKVLQIAILILSCQFLFLAFNSFWTDTEIWSVNLAQLFPAEVTKHTEFNYKPIFYGLLKTAYVFANKATGLFDFSRALFALLALAQVAILFSIAQQLEKKTLLSWIAVFTFMSTTFFIFRGFEIRSDYLAALFSLLWLSLFFKYLEHDRIRYLGLMIGLQVLQIWSTPKAFYFLVAEWGVILLAYLELRKRPNFVRISRLYAILALLFLSFLAIFQVRQSPNFLMTSYLHALKYFIDSFVGDRSMPGYLTRHSFEHFKTFFVENPLHSMLIYIGCIFAWTKLISGQLQRMVGPARYVHMYNCFICLGLVFHNDKLPFFITALLPTLVLGGILVLKDWRPQFLPRPMWLVAAVVGLMIVGAQLAVVRGINERSNSTQREAIEKIEDYLQQLPDSTYYDVIGVVPRRSTIFAYLGPGLFGQAGAVMQTLRHENPGIIFYTSKLGILQPTLREFLEEGYAPSGRDIFVRAAFVEGKGRITADEIVRRLRRNMGPAFNRFSKVYLYWPIEKSLVWEGRDGRQQKYTHGETVEEVQSKYAYLLLPAGLEVVAFSVYPPFPPLKDSLNDLFRFR